jgi:hypothetical protein
MVATRIDPTLPITPNDLRESTVLIGRSGETLGVFLTPADYRRIAYRDLDVPFTEEELDRFEAQGGGKPLSEIWKRLGVK